MVFFSLMGTVERVYKVTMAKTYGFVFWRVPLLGKIVSVYKKNSFSEFFYNTPVFQKI